MSISENDSELKLEILNVITLAKQAKRAWTISNDIALTSKLNPDFVLKLCAYALNDIDSNANSDEKLPFEEELMTVLGKI